MTGHLPRIIIIGAALGLSSQIAAMFPESKPVKQITERDERNILRAEQKRLPRQKRLIDAVSITNGLREKRLPLDEGGVL